MIDENIAKIHQDIAQVCRVQGRDPDDVILIGVTKYTTAEKAIEGIETGLTDLGESRVQDARKKFSDIGEHINKVRKHMIGHLQTNKVKAAIEVFDMIQSVDSLKVAREIDKQAAKMERQIECLIQVNCSGEEQKSGIAKDETMSLIRAVSSLKSLRLSGLMTIAPFTEEEDVIRASFRDLRLLKEEIAKEFTAAANIDMRHLSMGMSHDYIIALEEGANMLRIGSAIFQ